VTRVAVVDIGTNSTRLLVAEVDGAVRKLDRRTIITRLGEGVDRTGAVILIRVLEAYQLDRVEVSERDILWGVALASTSSG
jgi:exopolyphosphatase/pppGpp-phosphohydrolase